MDIQLIQGDGDGLYGCLALGDGYSLEGHSGLSLLVLGSEHSAERPSPHLTVDAIALIQCLRPLTLLRLVST